MPSVIQEEAVVPEFYRHHLIIKISQHLSIPPQTVAGVVCQRDFCARLISVIVLFLLAEQNQSRTKTKLSANAWKSYQGDPGSNAT
jgi:hypothetical protein